MLKQIFHKIKGKNNAQSLLEYVTLAVVLMSALFAMQHYIGRSVQGKWKESLDDMGKQYDPRTEITATHSIVTNGQTLIFTQEDNSGVMQTFRRDVTNATEPVTETRTISN